jgi:hypothetical protein
MWWSVLSVLASAQAEDALDPGCRGRVSKRDAELEFELQFDGEGKAVRSVLLRAGAGPSFARGSVQTRLRGRMDALHACYEPHVDEVRGPDVTLLVGFDVVDGRPANVSVESAFADGSLETCVQEVVEQTPMLCKLEATGFVFPVRFSTSP